MELPPGGHWIWCRLKALCLSSIFRISGYIQESHDKPNPEAISAGPSATPHVYCIFPTILPSHPTRLSTDAWTILQCAFGPRCGRGALIVSWPPNNALTEEVLEGSGVTDGFNKNSPSGSTPPQSLDLWPPINISTIWRTTTMGGSPFSFRGDKLLTVCCLF